MIFKCKEGLWDGSTCLLWVLTYDAVLQSPSLLPAKLIKFINTSFAFYMCMHLYIISNAHLQEHPLLRLILLYRRFLGCSMFPDLYHSDLQLHTKINPTTFIQMQSIHTRFGIQNVWRHDQTLLSVKHISVDGRTDLVLKCFSFLP